MRRDSLDSGALGVKQPRCVEVAARALEQRDVLLDRVLDERVHEPQRLAREHDLDARERVGRGRGRIDRESRQRRRTPERDVVAKDRDRPGQRRRRPAEPPDPDPERAGDGVGGETSGAARERVAPQALLVSERDEQLVQVERIATGHVDTGLDERRVRALAERPAGELVHGVGPERHQRLDPDAGVARDPVQRVGGLSAHRGPAGHDDRDRQLVEAVQHVQDELERGDVAPVQVVDRQQRRARLGDARHHREQPVGHREIAGFAGIEQILARAGERAHAFGRLRQEGTAARRRKVVQQSADELARGPEGEVLLELRASRT